MPEIQEITAEETLAIRHKVMWPNQPVDFVRLPNDINGRHFGLFIDELLVSVVSLFIKGKEAQFRKFATLKEHQRNGYGTALLAEIMQMAANEKVSKIWCNARVNKKDFYAKFEMVATERIFTKAGVDYVIMVRYF